MTDRPLSRQPACHLCGPEHEHHIYPCEVPGCGCEHDVAPGLYA